MLKLIGYEFRRARNGLFVLLGIIAAVQLWYTISLKTMNVVNTGISAVILVFLTAAAVLYVFVDGIKAYSAELKSRSGYMVFMTPLPTWQVVAGKLLYTLLNALLFAALLGTLAWWDMSGLLGMQGGPVSAWRTVKTGLMMYGINVSGVLMGLLLCVLYGFLELLCDVVLAYLAITLSHTLFRGRKWRWLPALVMYVLLLWGVFRLFACFPMQVPDVTGLDGSYVAVATLLREFGRQTAWSLVPSIAISVGVIVACIVLCAELLKRRVDL